jgi:alpha-beta hydrolase superfamily lysophospholipase
MYTHTVTLRHNELTGKLYQENPAHTTLVVVCHGYKSSSAHPALSTITKGLSDEGYATFTFNFSGRKPLDIASQIADIDSIVAHFSGEYPNIVLLAGSFGALSASIAAQSLHVKGLVTLNGFFGSARLGYRYLPTFLAFRLLAILSPWHKKIWNVFKHEFKPNRIIAPVLVIHSKVDEMVSVTQSKVFFQKVTSHKQFIELDDADHNLSSIEATKRIIAETDTWLKRTVSPLG